MSTLDRNAIFRANPMVEGFLSVLLQDLQLSENDEACMEEREARDTGTIYDCPDSTFRAVVAECEAFTDAIKASGNQELSDLLDSVLDDQIGSDLYLERAGHGVGFADRDCYGDDRPSSRALGEALSALVVRYPSLETYLGDDGKTYICGKESA